MTPDGCKAVHLTFALNSYISKGSKLGIGRPVTQWTSNQHAVNQVADWSTQ